MNSLLPSRSPDVKGYSAKWKFHYDFLMLILMLILNACVSGTVLKISAIQQFAGYLIYLLLLPNYV